jgi:hypothetical protein
MTTQETKQIVEILFAVDGGCKYCVADLLTLFCEELPEYKEIAERFFEERFGVELEDWRRK